MIVTLLTDFGLRDHYVAAMKGVILSRCPGVQLVDISHEVAAFAIPEAAYTLARTWPYFPPGTVHVAVIDPGVGSSRRPLLAEAEGHYFIGPDNGVLTMALEAAPSPLIRHITAERFFRQPVSRTFHGRDVFAPVAGCLAAGVPPAEFGEPVGDYIRLAPVRPVGVGPGVWRGAVLKVDHFGNIVTSFDWETFQFVSRQPFELHLGVGTVRRYCETYQASRSAEGTGVPFLIRGSADLLEVSVHEGNAAGTLAVGAGALIELRVP